MGDGWWSIVILVRLDSAEFRLSWGFGNMADIEIVGGGLRSFS